MTSLTFTKRICMNEISISLSTIPCQHFFSIERSEKLTAAFICIVSGSALLSTTSFTLSLHTGSLVYIPEETAYTLQWTADEEIRYYTLIAVAKDYNTAMMRDSFSLQTIPPLETVQTVALFDTLYDCMSCDDRIKKIEAVSLYYRFYAESLQYLQPSEPPALHRSLQMALAYIDLHYCENDSLKEIAKKCFISEARLSHLFREQLHTTPISYRNKKRIQAVADLLRTNASVEAICAQTGFESLPYFYRIFKRTTGITPNEYRRIIGRF